MSILEKTRQTVTLAVLLLTLAGMASGEIFTKTFNLDVSAVPGFDPNGLSATAVFTFDTNSPKVLKIELINTSTGVPAGFNGADQILTAISFDFGVPGYNGDPEIIDGTVVIGSGLNDRSINFDKVAVQLGPGADVTGEWGYGNMDGTGLLANFVTSNRACATRFLGDNLDGPENIDGPQAGVCTDPPIVNLGGLGAIVDSVIITITLDTPLSNLDFLNENGVMAEFGSDKAFLVPEPTTALLLFAGGTIALIRRRRK